MGARSIPNPRLAILPLLALLFLGASAAANSPERAISAARTAIDRGDVSRARKIIDGALREFAKVDAETVWTLRVMAAEILLMEGKSFAEVKKALAFELPAKYRRTPPAVRQMLYRAHVANELDEQNKEQLLEAAIKLATEHQPALLSEAYRARAVGLGREEDARAAVRYAQKLKQPSNEAKAKATLAFILAIRQRFAESVEVGEEALAGARQLGLANVIQNVEGNLGWAFFELGDYETAAELFEQAEAGAARIGNKRNQVSWLIQRGNVQLQKRDPDGADVYNRRAVELIRGGTARYDLGYALAGLARAAFEKGRYDEARKLNDQALNAKIDAGHAEPEMSASIMEARILALNERNFARAQKLLLEVLEKTRGHKLQAQTYLADVYVRANKHDLARATYEKAVETARAGRNTITDRELRLAFFNTAADLFDSYIDFLVATKSGDDEILAVIETSRAESLEEGTGTTSRLDLKAIAKQNGATILSYWLGRDRSYLWVITADGTKRYDLQLSDARIEREVNAYHRAVVVRQESKQTSGAQAQKLYNMLVAPAKIAKGTRVIVIADGQLHNLNFEILLTPERKYWIEDVIMTSAGSLQLLARKPGKAAGSPSMLLVGDAPTADPAFPRLKYAANEIKAIGARFKNKNVLMGAKATPDAYRAAMPGRYDYLHFVAHGVATRKRPLDSAVILAKGAQSYKLLAREVAGQPLKARLVTISSCESAGTRTYAGEGVIGLAWAFLRAGADQVIASLWKVSDGTTARLMDDMYAGIARGEDPAVALRNAKLRMVRSAGQTQKPFYWAPFVLYAGT